MYFLQIFTYLILISLSLKDRKKIETKCSNHWFSICGDLELVDDDCGEEPDSCRSMVLADIWFKVVDKTCRTCSRYFLLSSTCFTMSKTAAFPCTSNVSLEQLLLLPHASLSSSLAIFGRAEFS